MGDPGKAGAGETSTAPGEASMSDPGEVTKLLSEMRNGELNGDTTSRRIGATFGSQESVPDDRGSPAHRAATWANRRPWEETWNLLQVDSR